MAGAEPIRDSLGREWHRRERELLHQREAREREIADDIERRTGWRGGEDNARERKTKAKLRGKEIGRQRALLHREERERQEKEREREAERERARQQQRSWGRGGGVQQARDRELRESAGRSGDESTAATTDGDGKNSRRRSSGDGGDTGIYGESREARGGWREARDKRKRAVRGDAGEDSKEPPQLRGSRGGGGDGDSDFDGSPTVRCEFAIRRRRSGHEDCETRGSDRAREKNRSSSRKNERKERRWRESRDQRERTAAGRKSSDNYSIVGDGGRWQPSPSPSAIESRAPASASNDLERRPSPNHLPFYAWEPNRRAAGNSHQRRAAPIHSFFASRSFQRRGATGMFSPSLASRGMGSGTLDVGSPDGVARGSRGGMGSLSIL